MLFEPSLDDKNEEKGSVLKTHLKMLVTEVASVKGWWSAVQTSLRAATCFSAASQHHPKGWLLRLERCGWAQRRGRKDNPLRVTKCPTSLTTLWVLWVLELWKAAGKAPEKWKKWPGALLEIISKTGPCFLCQYCAFAHQQIQHRNQWSRLCLALGWDAQFGGSRFVIRKL